MFNRCQRLLPSFFLVGMLGLGLIACGDEINDEVQDSESNTTFEDRGDLLLTYDATDNQEFENIRFALEKSAFFDGVITEINSQMIFAEDIDVSFASCGESNAFYDPGESSITMCYELIQEYVAIFESEIETDEDYVNEVIDASSFTFFHELGHALVEQYELPITGNEEDAVDNFAAIMLLDFYGDDYGVISGMFQFEADAESEEAAQLEELAFWGEHSLSSQRFYDTACLIYGSDPDGFAFIVEEGHLPEERAELCGAEYEQKSDAWWTLLDPFLK